MAGTGFTAKSGLPSSLGIQKGKVTLGLRDLQFHFHIEDDVRKSLYFSLNCQIFGTIRRI